VIGSTVAAELETTIQRQVESSMSQDFLPMGSFTVSTLKVGNQAYQVSFHPEPVGGKHHGKHSGEHINR